MSTEAAVVCDAVVKIYETSHSRVQAVRGVDLRIPAASVVAITGPSGSGKSSLLDMIAGIMVPTAGHILVGGTDLAELGSRARRKARRRLLAYVEQNPSDNLLPHLTALDQVEQMADRRGADPRSAHSVLERLNLAHRIHHLPARLSGGGQQRLAFARAAVGSTVLIVADEPTAELDKQSADRVLDAIELLAAEGTAVIIATHDPRVIERVGAVVELRDGAIASVTSQGEVQAVIDGSGRLQLPPAIRAKFPTGTALLRWDDDDDVLRVERP